MMNYSVIGVLFIVMGQPEEKMMYENELIMLVLGLCLTVLLAANYTRMKGFPFSKILITGFYTLLAGWVATNLEGFFWEDFLNLIEHICYALSSVLVAIWCWKVFRKEREGR